MSNHQATPAPRAVRLAMVAMGIAMIAPCAFAAPSPGLAQPATETSATLIPPPAQDTRTNLQEAFADEVNIHARYEEAARVADREGYPAVARLFRACARSEQAHADQHVHAIAYTGAEAKAFLEKTLIGTTAENLRVAVDLEQYEARDLYPGMIARARAEGMTSAVRSMTYALAAEREHARLLASALETLEQRPVPREWRVCRQCGNTVAALEFRICPVCFGPARGFERVD